MLKLFVKLKVLYKVICLFILGRYNFVKNNFLFDYENIFVRFKIVMVKRRILWKYLYN